MYPIFMMVWITLTVAVACLSILMLGMLAFAHDNTVGPEKPLYAASAILVIFLSLGAIFITFSIQRDTAIATTIGDYKCEKIVTVKETVEWECGIVGRDK